MAFALQDSTTEEQRCVIRFLTAEGEKLAAIHRRMVTVYGEKCVSDKSVRKWSARFRAGQVQVYGDNIHGTGQVQVGDIGPSALQSGHVALRFPCVWSTEETPEREALQLGRRTQGRCEGLGLLTATGILGTRNPAACSSVGSLYSGLWCIF